MRVPYRTLSLVALALVAASGTARAGFSAGNLVLSIVGTSGGPALSNASTSTSLQEFTTAGGLVGSPIDLTGSAVTAGTLFTNSGTGVEAFLTLSGDGRYLTMGGYKATTGISNISGQTAPNVNRVVARIASDGSLDFSTALTNAASGGNWRSVFTTDGTNMWGCGTQGGARYFTLGATTSTQLSSSPTNLRNLNVFSGQLYVSAAPTGGTTYGVCTIGTGTPMTNGQTTTILPGFPTASGPSNNDFWFANSTTIYVADDRSPTATTGGIEKWVFSGGAWSMAYTLFTNLTAGCRALTGAVDGSGNAVLYATTADAATQLVTVTDTGAGSAFTTLATAASGQAFRGVDFAPVPAPGSMALLGLGGLRAARRRR